MDDIISNAKGWDYVSQLLCVSCVDLDWGVGDNGVTCSRMWMDGRHDKACISVFCDGGVDGVGICSVGTQMVRWMMTMHVG